MAKEMTTAELARIAKKGTVKFDPEDTNIARFGELIDKLNELLASNAARTQADLARSQVQLEVLATLQKNLRKQSSGGTGLSPVAVDLGPLHEILEELKCQRERCGYKFEIQRVEGGLMTGVIATPIEPVRH
jgi:hypothetical protein